MRSPCRLALLLLLLVGLVPGASVRGDDFNAMERECATKMRRVLEATQAYRRLHQGAWPDSLAELLKSGLVRPEELICPLILREQAAEHPDGYWASQGNGLDAPGVYQYELAATAGEWRPLKLKLLQRPGGQQVAVLRCLRHGAAEKYLNVTAHGAAYFSRCFWESNFVGDVPLPYRGLLLANRYAVPPFSAGLPARDARLPATAVDLAPWCNAYPADPWWWGGEEWQGKKAPSLAALSAAFPTGTATFGELAFDVRAIVQLGTYVTKAGEEPDPRKAASGYLLPSFPEQRLGLKLGGKARRVLMIMGCIWPDQPGHVVGQLVWHFRDRSTANRELRYGQDLVQFFGNDPAPEPCWSASESWGKARLWLVEWKNPKPELVIESIDFIAERTSPASPFLAGLSLSP